MSTLSKTAAGLGEQIVTTLGIVTTGQENRDLKGPCLFCSSSDAFRVNKASGVFHCYACEAGGSPFDLIKHAVGDGPIAVKMAQDLGIFSKKHHANGKCKNGHKHQKASSMASGTKPDPAKLQPEDEPPILKPLQDEQGNYLNPLDVICSAKNIPKGSLIAFGAKPLWGAGAIYLPSYAPDMSRRRDFSLRHDNKGKWPRKVGDNRVAGVFLPHSLGDLPIVPQPGSTWCVVEGCKDSPALFHLGYYTVGLPGCQMNEEFAPLFEGVSVTLVPDGDAPSIRGAKKTAARLSGVASSVRVARLPLKLEPSHGQDVRDVLKLEGGEQLIHNAIADATDAETFFADPSLHAEFAAIGQTLDTDGADDSDEADADNSQPQHARGDGGELDPEILAEWYIDRNQLDGYPTIRYWRGSFMRYCDGHYTEMPAVEVRADILRRLREAFTGLTQNVIGNAFEHVRASIMLDSRLEPPCWIDDGEPGWNPNETLVMRNGLVSLPNYFACEPHLLPPTPRFFATSAIGYDFDANAPVPERWLNFLNEIWGDDNQSIATFQEWTGYCLTSDTSQQKALMLVGPRRSGKGTVCRVMSAAVGSNNVAGPTLSSLSDRFGLWPLLDKTLAIFADVRLSGRADQATIVERLLSITGEDRQTVDRKTIQPVTLKLPARIMLVSNELPRLSDSSGALVGRLLLLRLRRSFFGEENPRLLEELLPELPGILLWGYKAGNSFETVESSYSQTRH